MDQDGKYERVEPTPNEKIGKVKGYQKNNRGLGWARRQVATDWFKSFGSGTATMFGSNKRGGEQLEGIRETGGGMSLANRWHNWGVRSKAFRKAHRMRTLQDQSEHIRDLMQNPAAKSDKYFGAATEIQHGSKNFSDTQRQVLHDMATPQSDLDASRFLNAASGRTKYKQAHMQAHARGLLDAIDVGGKESNYGTDSDGQTDKETHDALMEQVLSRGDLRG